MHKLKIITLNTNSIVSLARRHYLDQFLKNNKPDIVLISETKLHPKLKVSFKNYKVIRADRLTNRGGGCAIIIKENLDFKTLKIQNLINLEVAGISVNDTIGNRTLHIFAIYNRSCYSDFTTDLTNIINSAGNGDIVIGGDFNSRNPEWGDHMYTKSGRLLEKWLNNEGLMFDVSLIPTFYPTRQNSYLDFFITSNSLHIEFNPKHPYFLQTLDFESDHKAVEIIISNKAILKSNPAKIKDYKNTDIRKFHEIIDRELVNRTLVNDRNLTNQELIDAAENLNDILRTAVEQSVPEITLKERGLTPISDITIKLIVFKKTLRRRLYRTGNPIYKAQLRDISKIISEQIKIQTTDYWESKLSSIRMNKDTFKELKKLAGIKKNTDITRLKVNQVAFDDEKEIVDILANQFENVHKQNKGMGSLEHNNIIENSIAGIEDHQPLFQFNEELNSLKTNNHDDPLYKEFLNVTDLESMLKSRNNKKSAGNDCIPMYLLKKIPRSLKEHLVVLFNNMFNNAFIPPTWKQAKVCAILKPSKDPVAPESYRPISLMSNVSKTYEVFINGKLLNHVDDNRVLKDNQFGFRRGLSINHALSIFTADVAKNLSKRYGTIAIGIDTEKAFDTTWQSGIVHKMKDVYGFPIHLCKVILNYLKDRTFYVQQKDAKSELKTIAEGVPQGSILGPLLFNIFIADIPVPESPLVKTLGYADDILVYSSHPRLSVAEKHLNKYLKSYSNYTQNWKIKTNAAKCEAIKVTDGKTYRNAKRLKTKIKLGTNLIKNVKEMKYLGLVINSKFNFKKHLKSIVQKCNFAFSIYNRILRQSNKLNSKVKLIFYKQMVRSIISHAYPSWFHLSPSDMEILRRQERKFLRFCSNIPRNDNLKKISNKVLYENCKIIRIDNFLTKSAINYWNALNRSENELIQRIVNENVNLNDRKYGIKHLSLLNENNLLYNENNEIVYFNGRFDTNQYVC